MVRHRLRQSSNLLGPCGMVSMEDAVFFFQRIHIGSFTPGYAEFQKGVTGGKEPSFDVKQNDGPAGRCSGSDALSTTPTRCRVTSSSLSE